MPGASSSPCACAPGCVLVASAPVPSLSEATTTADEAKRYALYERCEQILADECPIAPLYFYNRNNLILPSVKGWYDNPVDMHPYVGVYLDAEDTRTP